MEIWKVEQQRQSNHKQFINKAKEFISDIEELKDQLINITKKQEAKSKF